MGCREALGFRKRRGKISGTAPPRVCTSTEKPSRPPSANATTAQNPKQEPLSTTLAESVLSSSPAAEPPASSNPNHVHAATLLSKNSSTPSIAPVEPSISSNPRDHVSSSHLPDNTLPTTQVEPWASKNFTSISEIREALWAQAYKVVEDRERDLMKDYKTHLASQLGTGATFADLTTSASVESIVTQLLSNREKKQWRIQALGKNIIIREQVEKLAKLLLFFDPVIKEALSSQPYAALAWSGISIFLPLLKSASTANAAMLKGLTSLGEIQMLWKICEETYLDPSAGQPYQLLIDPLAKLYSYIITYQARVICYLSGSHVSRASRIDWAAEETEISDFSEHCCKLIGPLQTVEIRRSRDSQLREMHESRAILDEVWKILKDDNEETLRAAKDWEERDLLGKLASNYEDDKNFNPERVQGTCEWFFADKRFLDWRDGCDSRLLWVSAGPGCGKSVLTRALIDEKRLSTNVLTSTICYFFFKEGDEGRRSATQALCAILHQIFTYHPAAHDLIQTALPKHKKQSDAFKTNFSELWRILEDCAESPNAGEIICAIDALDECERYSREILIAKLESLSKSSQASRLKFLITSRPYGDIEQSFELFSSAAYVRFDGDGKSKEISKEINLVIDVRVKEIASHYSENDRLKISKKLKSMENRTYLWLHLTLDIIKRNPATYSKRSQVEKLLSELPSQVSDAYEKILSRSEEKSQTEALLQILLAAQRPMTLDEANIALTLATREQPYASYDDLRSDLWPSANFETIVRNLCGLLISVHDSTLSFIHLTAREFLLDPRKKGTWQGRLSMPQSHRCLSLMCLDYMSLINDQSELEAQPTPPLLDYSSEYWLTHVKSGDLNSFFEKSVQKSAQESILKFFDQNGGFKRWRAHIYKNQSRWYSRHGHSPSTPLEFMCIEGLDHVVRLLLENGANPSENGGRALWFALSGGHKGIIQLWLKNRCTTDGVSLQAAAYYGHAQLLQLILEKGPDVDAKNLSGDVALHLASRAGHKEIVRLLINAGASVDKEAYAEHTALREASAGGHKEIVQLLLENGADTNAGRGDALVKACEGGYKEIVELLLQQGADTDAMGALALRGACSRGHHKVVELLIQAGVNNNVWLSIALEDACARGFKKIVELLLQQGAEVDTEYAWALWRACQGGHKEIVQLLIQAGADINAYRGKALQKASLRGSKRLVRFLLEQGADINMGGGALRGACYRGNKEMLQFLIEQGADINACGGALRGACEGGRIEMVDFLLEQGADLNACGGALGGACQSGRKEIVECLLQRGADINAGEGEALWGACYGGCRGIVGILLEKGVDLTSCGRSFKAAARKRNPEIVKLLLAKGADMTLPDGRSLQAAAGNDFEKTWELLLNIDLRQDDN